MTLPLCFRGAVRDAGLQVEALQGQAQVEALQSQAQVEVAALQITSGSNFGCSVILSSSLQVFKSGWLGLSIEEETTLDRSEMPNGKVKKKI